MYTTKDKPSLYQDSRPILDACRRVILAKCPARLCVKQSKTLQQCWNHLNVNESASLKHWLICQTEGYTHGHRLEDTYTARGRGIHEEAGYAPASPHTLTLVASLSFRLVVAMLVL